MPLNRQWRQARVSTRGRTGLLASGVVLAVVLGIAALVLSIISTIRGPEPSPPPQAPQADQQQLFVDDADHEFCDAMGPLMRESSDSRNYASAGWSAKHAGKKSGNTAVLKDSYDWADRVQDLLNQYSVPPRFYAQLPKVHRRRIMFAEGLSPTRDSSIYESQSTSVVYGPSGLIGRCSEVDRRSMVGLALRQPVTGWAFVGSCQALATLMPTSHSSQRQSSAAYGRVRPRIHGLVARQMQNVFRSSSSAGAGDKSRSAIRSSGATVAQWLMLCT